MIGKLRRIVPCAKLVGSRKPRAPGMAGGRRKRIYSVLNFDYGKGAGGYVESGAGRFGVAELRIVVERTSRRVVVEYARKEREAVVRLDFEANGGG